MLFRMIQKSKLVVVFLFTCSLAFGQMDHYDFKRNLEETTEQWHKIVLPTEIFGKTSQNLNDIRIFGLTEGNDTIEAPYLLRISNEKVTKREVAFKIINVSRNDQGYYYTFEIPTKESVNEINLDFSVKNFDSNVTLEGSQDQKEWLTIIEDYRILSIKNDLIDFQFTKLAFESSKYRFFRLLIKGKENLKLKTANVVQHDITDGKHRYYNIKAVQVKNNKRTKRTEIDIDMNLPVRASVIKLVVADTFDYYRPISIKYLRDSLKTEHGWKYNYSPVLSATLHSMQKKDFQFNGTTAKRFKISIENHRNQPLSIDAIQIGGYIHELIARFTEPANYFLAYGNKDVALPVYDIERFNVNIPDNLKALEIGDEISIKKEGGSIGKPLFENEIWLWLIMSVIILLLGRFSIKMIKNI